MALQYVEEKFEDVGVDLTFQVPRQGMYVSTVARFSAEATTSEPFNVWLKHPDDTDSDVLIESIDPSSTGGTNFAFRNRPLPLISGYKIRATYNNSDDLTITVGIYGTDSV